MPERAPAGAPRTFTTGPGPPPRRRQPHLECFRQAGLLSVKLSDLRQYQTVGGLLLQLLGHLPKPGTQANAFGWRCGVLDMDSRRIDTVLVSKGLIAGTPSGVAAAGNRNARVSVTFGPQRFKTTDTFMQHGPSRLRSKAEHDFLPIARKAAGSRRTQRKLPIYAAAISLLPTWSEPN